LPLDQPLAVVQARLAELTGVADRSRLRLLRLSSYIVHKVEQLKLLGVQDPGSAANGGKTVAMASWHLGELSTDVLLVVDVEEPLLAAANVVVVSHPPGPATVTSAAGSGGGGGGGGVTAATDAKVYVKAKETGIKIKTARDRELEKNNLRLEEVV
jgi:hypothetical protein